MMALLFSFAAMLMVWDEGKKKNWKHGEMSEVEERKRGREFYVSSLIYVCVLFFIYFAYVSSGREGGRGIREVITDDKPLIKLG